MATTPGAPPRYAVPELDFHDWVGGDGRAVVGVRGELDIATADRLVRHLSGRVARQGREVVVDLSEVAFCDCSGLNALFLIADVAEAAGSRVVLAAPRPNVAKVLRLGGLDRRLPVRRRSPPATGRRMAAIRM